MEEYLRRLADHANLGEDYSSKSLLPSLWEAEKTKIFPDLSQLCDDVLLCLEKANVRVNGPTPSETTTPGGDIPRSLALYVSEIVHRCHETAFLWEQQQLFTTSERKLLQQTVWKIMEGWCCILHGDIDEIADDVRVTGEVKEIL